MTPSPPLAEGWAPFAASTVANGAHGSACDCEGVIVHVGWRDWRGAIGDGLGSCAMRRSTPRMVARMGLIVVLGVAMVLPAAASASAPSVSGQVNAGGAP